MNKEQNKKYNIIYADPPWKQTKGGIRKCRPNQNKNLDYKTISIEQIKSILENASKLTSENSILFLWTIDKFLFEAEQIAKELGYKLHARLIWNKTNGVAPAFTVRFAHEYLLWFYKGKFKGVDASFRGKYTTVFEEKSTKHSKKPQIIYDFIKNCYPNTTKLELFAREETQGWDVFGDEVENSIKL